MHPLGYPLGYQLSYPLIRSYIETIPKIETT